MRSRAAASSIYAPGTNLLLLPIEYMTEVHDQVAATAEEFNCPGDLHVGTNIYGFIKVASAMFRQGSV